MGACVKSGDEITLVCEGEDEQAAIDALVALIEGGLGEVIRNRYNNYLQQHDQEGLL